MSVKFQKMYSFNFDKTNINSFCYFVCHSAENKLKFWNLINEHFTTENKLKFWNLINEHFTNRNSLNL